MKLEVQKLQEDLQCSEEKCSQLENQVKQVRIFSVTLFRRVFPLFTAMTSANVLWWPICCKHYGPRSYRTLKTHVKEIIIFSLTVFQLFTSTAICSLFCLNALVAYIANNLNPDQTAPKGSV